MSMTELGKNTFQEAKEYGLVDFYEPYMGNFQFCDNDLFENMNKVLMWLEHHQDYCLISQKGYVYDSSNTDYHWFLTPQSEL